MNQMSPPSQSADLIAEANHRVANSLTLLGGLVRMKARAIGKAEHPPSNAELRLMFDGIAARIATIAHLHRMLAHMPGEGTLSLGPHLREVCDALVKAFSSEQQPVHIDYSCNDCQALTRHVQPLTLIICELLTNAIKYAHPAGVPIQLRVICESRADGDLFVSVSDDGVGLPEGFDLSRHGGIGFQVIRALSSEIGAHLDMHSDSLGATFNFTVPAALAAQALTG